MDAKFVLESLRRKYPLAAIVPELTIEDFDLPDSGMLTDALYTPQGHVPEGHKYERRIDALMFESLVRTAIEIKVSKADFNRDTYWKRRAWQQVTHRFVYVVPHDLDVMPPHGCGLWKVGEDGSIVVVKKAIVSRTPDPLPQIVTQRIAYRAAAHKWEAGGE
ncbi:hypothetical protein D9V32_15585 [Mycetocola tolaasinivorans]|uniref:MmcB family DNA repair protein n=1 Tax=Mycetocola tolaasinivorans TaxID=76635 RepID=A0A3L6ZX16_9MICO|nr:hypothetical protein [Mycetocola tolaasinivorans]RLP72314.1 hypothetical protein D9V32_15585 [Mycetocola tolaasinivorans]